jgi:uncharacterized membrane protein
MEKKIDIQFDNDLDYIIELKGELVEAKTLMKNAMKTLDQYRGANLVLCSYLTKYDNLSENAKKHLNVDMNELEKLAIETLIAQGHTDILNRDLLKKHGYKLVDREK